MKEELLEQLRLLSKFEDELSGVWIEFFDGIITSINFENETFTVRTVVNLGCGCCSDYEFETINFSELDEDDLETVLNDPDIINLK